MRNEMYINDRFIIHNRQTTNWTESICQIAYDRHPFAGSLGPVEIRRAYEEGVDR